jgi:hypothetical protein
MSSFEAGNAGAGPEPVCSLCGRKIERLQRQRYPEVIGEPLPTLYLGVVCTMCRSLVCLECQGKPSQGPCKKCGGKVVPAQADVIWMTPKSYLFLFQKSKAPSQELMQIVLNWWRGKHGQDFEMLGGLQVDHVPDEIDPYIATFMHELCDQHGFDALAEKLGYSSITVSGEPIGVARFLSPKRR